MLECFIKFMDKNRFVKNLLIECGALTFCPKNYHLVRTTDERYLEFTVELARQIFIACSKFQTAEELEKYIREVAGKHAISCDFCTDKPEHISHNFDHGPFGAAKMQFEKEISDAEIKGEQKDASGRLASDESQ